MGKLRLLLVVAFIASCHSSAKLVAVSREEHEKGKNLLAESDCLTCHLMERRMIGPSYMQIANKYAATEANIQKLGKKIITVGSGNWGPIPMTPHNNLDKDDAEVLVKYILSIKNFH